MTDGSVRVLGFAGSLRAGSFNRMLLRAAQALAPPQVDVTIHDLTPIPLYNFDVEQQGDPEPVRVFKENIAAADAVLVVTPEYQQGVPGVLKNALDWASRPPGRSALQDKPVAIMGATPGRMMTARAQTQLRQVLGYNSCFLVARPEVVVGGASEKFDQDGRLRDEPTATLIRQLLDNLVDLTQRLRTR